MPYEQKAFTGENAGNNTGNHHRILDLGMNGGRNETMLSQSYKGEKMINNPTLKQILKTLPKEQRICIFKDQVAVYVGFNADITAPLGANPINPVADLMNHYVSKAVTDTEVRHRKWKENRYTAPIEPDNAPDYEFRDIEMKTYLKIYI